MRKTSFGESVRLIGRGIRNWVTEKPLVVIFAVTDSCSCHCKHCEYGGPKQDAEIMLPGDYGEYVKALRPNVVHVSGGEPLLRKDIVEVVSSIKEPNGLLPYLILVSNWSPMTKELYLKLRDAGLNQFSVSLDFPDERHDDFRGSPGLFAKLDRVIPSCAELGYDDIVLNTCITSENYRHINDCADVALDWGVNINFSLYSTGRTGDESLFPGSARQLSAIKDEFDSLNKRRNGRNWITNSKTNIDETYRFINTRGRAGCQAGRRFLEIKPDGKLQPCFAHGLKYELEQRREMIREFTERNACGQCYVSVRAYLDKGFWRTLYEYGSAFFSFRPLRSFKNRTDHVEWGVKGLLRNDRGRVITS
ncbi:MAG: radical SAM protein [bacterium]